jgi:hypothetical protein
MALETAAGARSSSSHAAIMGAARFTKRFFYTFLDISGILLGVFLLVLGRVGDQRTLDFRRHRRGCADSGNRRLHNSFRALLSTQNHTLDIRLRNIFS